MGRAYQSLGDFDRAIIAYDLALALDPTYQQAYYNKGLAYQEEGMFVQALNRYHSYSMFYAANYSTYYSLYLFFQYTLPSVSYYYITTSFHNYFIITSYHFSMQPYKHQPLPSLHPHISYQQAIRHHPHQRHLDAKLNSCNIHFAQDNHLAAEECYLQVVQWDDTYVRGMVNLAAFYQATLPSQISSQMPSQIPSQDYLAQATRALELYHRALVVDPLNHMARHGQTSLRLLLNGKQGGVHEVGVVNEVGVVDEVEVVNEMGVANDGTLLSTEYVTELFDSYSFHFDTSLQALEYTSHLLVAEAVGEYLYVRAPLPSQIQDAPSQMYLGLDLGAGTGLACEPVKSAVVHILQTQAQGLRQGLGPGLEPESGQESGQGPGQGLEQGSGPGLGSTVVEKGLGSPNQREVNPHWRGMVGILGVDLSSKMLQKARRRGCYGDLITGDVTTFVQEYASKVQANHHHTYRDDSNANDSSDNNIAGDGTRGSDDTNTTGSTVHDKNDDDEHPLLDFVVAADVFMYLSDLTVKHLSFLFPLTIKEPVPLPLSFH